VEGLLSFNFRPFNRKSSKKLLKMARQRHRRAAGGGGGEESEKEDIPIHVLRLNQGRGPFQTFALVLLAIFFYIFFIVRVTDRDKINFSLYK
jgi:hypothetical protein